MLYQGHNTYNVTSILSEKRIFSRLRPRRHPHDNHAVNALGTILTNSSPLDQLLESIVMSVFSKVKSSN